MSANNRTIEYKITDDSMLPILQPGDIAIYRRISVDRTAENDIVLIQTEKGWVVGRIIFKDRFMIAVKADNRHKAVILRGTTGCLRKLMKLRRGGKEYSPENYYVYQSAVYMREILKVKRGLEKSGIPYLFLKGLPVHRYIEKSNPARIYADCDLLVDRRNSDRVRKIMMTHGYAQAEMGLSGDKKIRQNSDVETVYVKNTGGIEVLFDIHFDVVFMMTQVARLDALYPKKMVDGFTRECLEQRKIVRSAGNAFPVLAPAYLVVYLALHLFHHNFQGAHRYRFLDRTIRMLSTAIDWKKTATIAVDYKFESFIHPVFILLKKYYATPVSVKFMSALRSAVNVDVFAGRVNIFDDEQRVAAGIRRFYNLFRFSPRPLHEKLGVFFNREVLSAIVWSISRKFRNSR